MPIPESHALDYEIKIIAHGLSVGYLGLSKCPEDVVIKFIRLISLSRCLGDTRNDYSMKPPSDLPKAPTNLDKTLYLYKEGMPSESSLPRKAPASSHELLIHLD